MSTSVATPPVVQPSTEAPAHGSQRLVSLDAFRGVTIVGMILVNNPGTWSAIYPPLRHAAWHGWTPTDLIFPFFLFIVGVAVTLAYHKRLERGHEARDLLGKTFKRSLVLFGLGLMIAAYPFFQVEPSFGLREGLEQLRIPGVLQRIAVCYFLATLLFLYVRPRWQYVLAGVILLGYWAAMTLVPVPGYGAGVLDQPEATLAAYLDRLLLGEHLWSVVDRRWDPEGILSTLPALVTTLIGVWAGRLFISDHAPLERAVRLLAYGVGAVVTGYVWSWFFPVNKALWTSSYVLLTGGQALCALGVCYWLSDVRGYTHWAQPFVVYGMNAITVFVLSGILAKTLAYVQVPTADGMTSLQRLIYTSVFAPVGSPELSSLLYAIVWIGAWYLVLRWMYARRLFIKV